MSYLSSQLLPDSPTHAGSRLSLRSRAVALVLALALAALVGAWQLFAHRATAPELPAVAQARTIAVVTVYPTRKPFPHEVEALGTIRANESVDVTAKIAERVVAIHFQEGEQVRKGEVLVELDQTEVKADLAAAEAAASDSRSQYKRSQELYRTRALSEAQLEQLQAALLANEARVEAARARLNDRIIRAPFAGRVGLRNVSVGSLVSPGEVITTLDDLSIVKLDCAVPELFLATLQPGLTIEARSRAFPGEAFEGRVDSVATRVDPATRSIKIRALIDNRDRRLRPGMFMTVKLVRSEGQALMLPEAAIVSENDRHFVYVIENQRAYQREVTTGRRRPGEVEILAGLTPHDQVVVEGTLNLREGTLVHVQSEAGGPDQELDAPSTAAPGAVGTKPGKPAALEARAESAMRPTASGPGAAAATPRPVGGDRAA